MQPTFKRSHVPHKQRHVDKDRMYNTIPVHYQRWKLSHKYNNHYRINRFHKKTKRTMCMNLNEVLGLKQKHNKYS